MARNDLANLSDIRGYPSPSSLIAKYFETILNRALCYSDVTNWSAGSISKSVFDVLLRECNFCAWQLHSVTISTIRMVVQPKAKPLKDSPEDLSHTYVC